MRVAGKDGFSEAACLTLHLREETLKARIPPGHATRRTIENRQFRFDDALRVLQFGEAVNVAAFAAYTPVHARLGEMPRKPPLSLGKVSGAGKPGCNQCCARPAIDDAVPIVTFYTNARCGLVPIPPFLHPLSHPLFCVERNRRASRRAAPMFLLVVKDE